MNELSWITDRLRTLARSFEIQADDDAIEARLQREQRTGLVEILPILEEIEAGRLVLRAFKLGKLRDVQLLARGMANAKQRKAWEENPEGVLWILLDHERLVFNTNGKGVRNIVGMKPGGFIHDEFPEVAGGLSGRPTTMAGRRLRLASICRALAAEVESSLAPPAEVAPEATRVIGRNDERDAWLNKQAELGVAWATISICLAKMVAETGWEPLDGDGVRKAIARYRTRMGLPTLARRKAGRIPKE